MVEAINNLAPRCSIPHALQGVIAPMLTPVRADLSLDFEGTAAMVEWLISRGCVTTVFARSGMGGMFTFTLQEALQLGAAVMQAAAGRIHVLLGASGEWLNRSSDVLPDADRYIEQAVELTRFAQEIGADGAVHVVPEVVALQASEPIQDAIYRYYTAVHDCCRIPIVLYQPGSTRPECRVTPELLSRLLELPRIAGMKVSTSVDALFSPLAIVAAGRPFALIAGDETYYLSALRQGAAGVIGEGCSVYPEILAALRSAVDADRLEQAERAQADVLRALAVKREVDGAVFWKQYLIQRGVRIGPYDRNGARPYPADMVCQLSRAVDEIVSPYRSF